MNRKNMNSRIKEVRKALGYTMKAFGQTLGLSESAVSRIESGSANPSEGVVKLICSIYAVDYFWLTEGKGEMFVGEMDVLIDSMASEKKYTKEETDLLKKLFSLPQDQFDLVMGIIENFKEENKKNETQQ